MAEWPGDGGRGLAPGWPTTQAVLETAVTPAGSGSSIWTAKRVTSPSEAAAVHLISRF